MTTEDPIDGLRAPFGRHPIEGARSLALRIGAQDLWIRSDGNEIRIAERHREGSGAELAAMGDGEPPPEPEPDSDWSRWALPAAAHDIIVRPALPDRTVVLQPDWPFRLVPGADARVFVRVPVVIRIDAALDDDRHTLLRLPSVPMSDTWWGDLNEGELSYWLPTTARRALTPEVFAPHVAVCPLQMRNGTESELRVDKLALRVAHLSLYHAQGRVWADETRVDYMGTEEGSRIDMSGEPPPEAGDAVLLAPPAVPVLKGLRARTFQRLRSLQPPGWFG